MARAKCESNNMLLMFAEDWYVILLVEEGSSVSLKLLVELFKQMGIRCHKNRVDA